MLHDWLFGHFCGFVGRDIVLAESSVQNMNNCIRKVWILLDSDP